MSTADYGLMDADQHYYEPYDCYSKHIEKKYADDAIRVVKNEFGLGEVKYRDRILSFMPFTPIDNIMAPGCLKDLFAGKVEGGGLQDFGAQLSAYPADENPGWVSDRSERLKIMDQQGVEGALILPTLGVGIENSLSDQPEALFANVRSFNRWVAEEWGFGKDGRIYSPAILSLLDLDLAVAELDRLIAEGVKLINLRPGPVYGKSPADPSFDPFWARVQEAGILVTLHSGDAGYNQLWAKSWGEDANSSVYTYSMFQHYIAFVERPIVDTIAALVLHNLFGRFPGLKFLSIESGANWLPHLLHQLDHAFLLAGGSPGNIGGSLPEKPSEILRQHIYVSPFVEDDVKELAEAIGTSHVLMGSDYPHPEGNAEPRDFFEGLDGMSAEDTRLIMRDNLAGLLNVGG